MQKLCLIVECICCSGTAVAAVCTGNEFSSVELDRERPGQCERTSVCRQPVCVLLQATDGVRHAGRQVQHSDTPDGHGVSTGVDISWIISPIGLWLAETIHMCNTQVNPVLAVPHR
eukprot:492137-Pelagomonas_calceolata.AAC.13